MPNPIKYSTGSETLALKKGNLYIGTGAVGKGPSETTGYYQGPNVPSGGYVIYMNKEGVPGNLSYHSAANDAQLISFTNSIAGQSYTGVNQCFDYYYSQNDKVLVNQDYPADYPYIVMDNLYFCLDAGISLSYPGTGTTWYDINGLGPKNNGTLLNGVTFSGGSMSFDGVDDLITVPLIYSITSGQSISYEVWVYPKGQNGEIINKGTSDGGSFPDNPRIFLRSNGSIYWDWSYPGTDVYMNFSTINCTVNQWNQVVGVAIAGGSLKVYINGSDASGSVSGGNLPNPLPTTTNDLQIGGVTWVPRYNNASIAIVRVYQKELTATEVLQNYNATKGRFGL
jgi:hypothetical protein